MGLLDLFSDSNEKKAAGIVDKGYQKGLKDAKKAYKKGFKGLKKDYAAGLKTINRGADTASSAVTGGRDAALAEYQPYTDATSGAAGLYSDAIGINGADGNGRAVEAFRTSPGYEFRMNQGLQALQRLNASRGSLNSGNTLLDTVDYAGGLADQEYGSWLDRLDSEQQFGAGIAGQRAGIYTGTGGALADIATGASTRGAAIKTGRGDVSLGLGEKLGDLSYATRLGRAGVNASYEAGKDATGSNIFGTIAGGASLGAKLLGGA